MNDPPEGRTPIRTILTEQSDSLVREAILHETDRGGQVYFVHNRVDTLPAWPWHSPKVTPERPVSASVTDRCRQAYAYLLLPRHASLLNDVRKRLSAIKQYSTLGSGFKIAMRDLEIRGAGNLLGAEQSGHITAVGFDLYCQLLKQSVSALKGEKVKPRLEVQVRLDFLPLSPGDAPASDNVKSTEPGEQPLLVLPDHAAIPYTYIADPRQRIEIYRKLAQANDTESLKTLQAELRDRFGPPPPAVERLCRWRT